MPKFIRKKRSFPGPPEGGAGDRPDRYGRPGVERVARAVVVAPQVVQIILAPLALLVGTLDDPPRRSVVAGHGDAHGRTVGQADLPLHKALAEARAADHDAAVPVLHGPGHDLRGRSRRLVHQNHQPALHVLTRALRLIGDRRNGASLG